MGTEHSWLKLVSPEAKKVIQEYVKETNSRWHGYKDSTCQWWVRCSPTTGIAKNVTLIRKVDGTVIREIPIMKNGKLAQ